MIGKTNRRSRVHRRARMDDVSVRVLRPDGTIAGLLRVIGLFTSLVYLEQASRTPLLRRKLQAIIEAEGLMEGSHDYKATVAAFESFPRDELFQAPVDALRAEIVAAARAEEAQRVTLTVRQDAASRNITVMVAMPGDRMSTELRMRLQDLLAQRFHAESVEYHLALVEDAAAQLFFLLHIPAGQAHRRAAATSSSRRSPGSRAPGTTASPTSSSARYGDAEGRRLAVLYSARLPGYYKSATPPDLALADIALLERVAAGEEFAVGLQNELAAHTQVGARPLTRVAVATTGGKIPLGEFLPILEALGLTVVEEVPTRLDGGDDGAYLHDFGVLVDDAQLSCERDGERISEAITAIWSGRVESDTLNALVVRAGLRHDDVVILRAYRRYRRIVAPTFTAAYQNDVLASHPQTARALVELFRARFCDEPDEAREQELRAQLDAQLAAVGSLDEDRILRGFAALIDATVRTNAALGRPYLSFKLRSADVPQMPEPAPLFEIFVYHPLVEGIHLRGGHVARGGIRWSDRREDYRSEVLGLMKAQMVKNAVIVPVGAKGGFVLRAPPADRDLLRAEVQLRYSTLIRGMLDVTDNIVGGEVVRPAGVRAFDEDDPYLVVAADKGTAALSDTANAIALEYGFWLGDAFASGGSKGYDHKAARHHGARRLGERQAALPRARPRRRLAPVHGRGHRRHVRRRLRQRHAAVAPDPARRGLRPPPRVPRPGARCGRLVRRAPAAVRARRRHVVGRLRPLAHLAGRRRVAAHGEVGAALARGARRPRRRGRVARSGRARARDPARPGRPALERRHRHVRQGLGRDARRGRAIATTTPFAWTAASCAPASSARAATSA